MTFLFLGLLAGSMHVLTGPDHLAAVAPYAVEERGRRAWLVGLRWGVGHTSGVWIVSLLAFLLREVLPVERLSLWSERLVGVVLIAIGVWGVRAALTRRRLLHAHEHGHEDGTRHAHVHVHASGDVPHHHSGAAHRQHTHAPLAVGTLHGLAGSSHLLGVLPALALPSRTAAAAYLLAFGLGSIAAMALFSSVIGLAAGRFAGPTGSRTWAALMGACSLAAVGVGIWWLAQAASMT
jgi:ABC-type nickel/cobalt efflux system permease component RcnA